MMIKLSSPAETEALGAELGSILLPGDVICLTGRLGAGKTTFARGVARGWGSLDTVTSPSYTLVNEYRRPSDDRRLYHLDCYRLPDADEAESIGIDDLLNGREPVLIEWADRIEDWLPTDRLTIHLSLVNPELENQRVITIHVGGPRSRVLRIALTGQGAAR